MNQAEIKRRQAEEIANILLLITIFILGNRIAGGGITYMASAVYACALVGIAVSGSLADTLGRLLRSRRNKGQYKNILAMRKSAMLFGVAMGVVGTLLPLFFAGGIAEGIFRIPYSKFIVMALAPAVLLRTLACVLQGYFQGEASESPRAVASILRQLFTLVFGVLFCNIAGSYGEKASALLREKNYAPMYSGIGIALAVCLAEVFVILFLVVLFKGSRRNEKRMRQDNSYTGASTWDCILGLCAGRWPHFVLGLLKLLPLPLGLAVFARRTAEEPDAVFQYDVYAGRYLVICGILFCLISILVLPILGRVFLSFRKEESRFARTVFQSGVHICLVHGIFISVYVAMMGAQISGLFGGEDGELVKQMLQGGSFAIAFASLSVYFTRFLNAMGKKYFLLGAVGIAEVVFVVTVLVTSKQGILSLVYGGVSGTLVLCVILGVLSYRVLRIRMDWIGTLVMPLGAGVIAGLLCMLFGRLFTESLGNLAAALLSFMFSGAVYWVLLFVLRNFKEQELELFPGGRLLGKLGQMLHIY